MWPASDPLRGMSSSVAPPVPQQQQGGGGSSSSGSHHASSTSTSESDTDSSDDEWKSVPFSFLLTNQLIADVQQQRKLKPPERSPSHTHPAPTKLELSGEFKFVEYIPEWTHPDWDDDYITVAGEKEPRGKIFNNDFSRKLRAALLPKDSLRNPTPYARRWGMHPDRTDGRSRLSPTGSSTRRVGLSQPMRTADNQLRLFLSGQDLPADLEARASDLGMSAADYLDSAAVSSQTDPQTLSPLRELFGMNEGDKDFQRLLFLDMTTDEVADQPTLYLLDPSADTCFTRNSPTASIPSKSSKCSTIWPGRCISELAVSSRRCFDTDPLAAVSSRGRDGCPRSTAGQQKTSQDISTISSAGEGSMAP